jgi:hypothetical protein
MFYLLFLTEFLVDLLYKKNPNISTFHRVYSFVKHVRAISFCCLVLFLQCYEMHEANIFLLNSLYNCRTVDFFLSLFDKSFFEYREKQRFLKIYCYYYWDLCLIVLFINQISDNLHIFYNKILLVNPSLQRTDPCACMKSDEKSFIKYEENIW